MLIELIEFLVLLLQVVYGVGGLIRALTWLEDEVVVVRTSEKAGTAAESGLFWGIW